MKHAYMFFVLILLTTSSWCFADFREPELKTLQAYSRLVFPVNSNGSFKIQGKPAEGGVAQLTLERVRVSEWAALPGLRDSRVNSVQVKPVGLEGAQIEINFKQNHMEFFAYLQPSPPAVIVDVWPSSSSAPTVAVKSQPAKKARTETKIAESPAKAGKPIKRVIASIGEVERPVPGALSLEKDFFQRFILPLPIFEAKGVKFSSPAETDLENDWDFGKVAEGKKDEASQTYRFAARLFREKKFGLCIKALEITERDFPNSPYAGEQSFLKAMAYKRLGELHQKPTLVVRAETTLRELMTKLDANGKNLPFSPAIRLYFASKSYKEEQWLETIEQLEFVVKLLGESDPDYPVISMVLADAYREVGQVARAERIYRYVSEKQRGKLVGKEALFRIGAILALNGNHKRAIEETERAINTYPDYASVRTEAYFNLGEAYFWSHNYKKSEAAFKNFIDKNPSQTNGALALARLGEISELTRQPAEEARKSYLAAINGFPFSEGATVATLRMARLDLSREPDLKYHVRTLAEILKKTDLKREELNMALLLSVQTRRYLGETDLAIEESLKQMSLNTGEPYAIFREQYIQSQGEHLAHLLSEKKFAEVLSHFDANKNWLEMYGPSVYRTVADAYKGLGLYDSSNHFMTVYADAAKSNGGRSLASTLKPIELENYYSQGNYKEVLRSLPKDPETLDEVEMAMISHFRLNQFAEAYRLAVQLNERSAELSDSSLINITEVLTHRAFTDKNFVEMESLLAIARRKLKSPDERIDFLYADSLWYQRKHEQAIAAYTQAIENFPKSERVIRSKYNLAMSTMESGKRREGVKLLTELRDSGQSVWAASAKQELELLDWESKYSAILKGLPPSGLGIVR